MMVRFLSFILHIFLNNFSGSVIQFQWGTTEPPKTLMEKSGRGPVFRLEWVAEKNYLFIVTLKECLIWRFGEKTSLFMG